MRPNASCRRQHDPNDRHAERKTRRRGRGRSPWKEQEHTRKPCERREHRRAAAVVAGVGDPYDGTERHQSIQSYRRLWRDSRRKLLQNEGHTKQEQARKSDSRDGWRTRLSPAWRKPEKEEGDRSRQRITKALPQQRRQQCRPGRLYEPSAPGHQAQRCQPDPVTTLHRSPKPKGPRFPRGPCFACLRAAA